MNFVLMVNSSPQANQATKTAYHFAKAAIEQGHSISQVFFFRDGVHNASALPVLEQQEHNYGQLWVSLGREAKFPCLLCSGSALRRGILDKKEASRHEKPSSNLLAGFEIAGLGQFTGACLTAERVVTFGGY